MSPSFLFVFLFFSLSLFLFFSPSLISSVEISISVSVQSPSSCHSRALRTKKHSATEALWRSELPISPADSGYGLDEAEESELDEAEAVEEMESAGELDTFEGNNPTNQPTDKTVKKRSFFGGILHGIGSAGSSVFRGTAKLFTGFARILKKGVLATGKAIGNLPKLFTSFTKKFNKKYSTKEEAAKRQQLVNDKAQKIAKFNSGADKSNFILDLQDYSDQTDEEYSSKKVDLNPTEYGNNGGVFGKLKFKDVSTTTVPAVDDSKASIMSGADSDEDGNESGDGNGNGNGNGDEDEGEDDDYYQSKNKKKNTAYRNYDRGR